MVALMQPALVKQKTFKQKGAINMKVDMKHETSKTALLLPVSGLIAHCDTQTWQQNPCKCGKNINTIPDSLFNLQPW
jgi:hypothetical protein